jgi:hypothetical protein
VQRPGLKDLFDIDLKNLRVSVIAYKAFHIKSVCMVLCTNVMLLYDNSLISEM